MGFPEAPRPTLCIIDTVNYRTPYARCRNYAGTKFNLPIEKMDKYVAMPGQDYIETMTYLNKLVEVLRREIGR